MLETPFFDLLNTMATSVFQLKIDKKNQLLDPSKFFQNPGFSIEITTWDRGGRVPLPTIFGFSKFSDFF